MAHWDPERGMMLCDTLSEVREALAKSRQKLREKDAAPAAPLPPPDTTPTDPDAFAKMDRELTRRKVDSKADLPDPVKLPGGRLPRRP